MQTNAKAILDEFLFGDIWNNREPDEDKWAITFEGDNYVVWDKYNDQLYHFRVIIEEYDWDSSQVIAGQEWDV